MKKDYFVKWKTFVEQEDPLGGGNAIIENIEANCVFDEVLKIERERFPGVEVRVLFDAINLV